MRKAVTADPSGEAHTNSSCGRSISSSAGRLNTEDFLSISNVRTSNEEGLLGLAFHPDYATNGFVYIYYSRKTGERVFRRRGREFKVPTRESIVARLAKDDRGVPPTLRKLDPTLGYATADPCAVGQDEVHLSSGR